MSFWAGLFHNDEERLRLIEFHKHHSGETPPWGPLVASLLLTYRCNFHCRYCPFHKKASDKEYHESSREEWMEVIDRLCTAGVRRISFSGGEPTLYRGLSALIRHAHDRNCITSLVTNGHSIESLLPEFKDAGLDAVTVSIDSIDAAVFQSVRRSESGQLQTILPNLIKAAASMQLWIALNVVLTKENCGQIEDLIDFCSEYHISMQVQPCNPIPETEDHRPDPHALESVVPALIAARHPSGPVLNSEVYILAIQEFVRTIRLPRALKCLIPYTEMVIEPDLHVQACCRSQTVGHALEEDLAQIWNNRGYAIWRRRASEANCMGCMLLYHEPLRAYQ